MGRDDTNGACDDDRVGTKCDDHNRAHDYDESVVVDDPFTSTTNYVAFLIMTSINDVALWRVYKSIYSFTTGETITWSMVFLAVHLLSCGYSTLNAPCISCTKCLPLP